LNKTENKNVWLVYPKPGKANTLFEYLRKGERKKWG